MSSGQSGQRPDPARIRDRRDFGRELTLLRELSGLTVRQVAAKAGSPGAHSTIGDWCAGRGLPSPSSVPLLERVLAACGVAGPGTEGWLAAWSRARRTPESRQRGDVPYRGLYAFQPEDHEWFFGRSALTAELLSRVRQTQSAGGGALLVVGASGAGKSSLLRAGLVAGLRSTGRPVALLVPGEHPEQSWRRHVPPHEGGPPPVIVVDQAEELFTSCVDDGERQAFLARLAAHAGAVIVLGLRADFYGRALREPVLAAAARERQLVVGPIGDAEISEVIEAPAARAGLTVEAPLVALLVQETQAAGAACAVLPLLSHALYATWRAGPGASLTVADYQAVGGIRQAVAASAESVYTGLDAAQRDTARALLLSLVHVAPDTSDTRRRLPLAQLAAQPGSDVLDRFVAQRLVTVDAESAEISHEALLHEWPRLRGWLDADRAGLITGRRIANAAAGWAEGGRDAGMLYRGGQLAAALEWLSTAGAHASPPVHDFLAESQAQAQAQEALARRGARRLRRLACGLAAALVLAVAGGAAAVQGRRVAHEQRDLALSAKTAGEATGLRTTDSALAARLSLAAYRLAATPEARGSLLSTGGNPYAATLRAHTAAVYATAVTADGRLMATASSDRTARLWDIGDPRGPRLLAVLPTHPDGLLDAAFSPVRPLLATACADGVVRLWDVADASRPAPLGELRGHTDGVRRISFSADGSLIATAGRDRTARLWQVTDPVRPASVAILTGHRDGVSAAVFGRGDSVLATTSGDGSVRLWNVADPSAPTPSSVLVDRGRQMLTAAFSPDGTVLATGGFDNVVRLWSVRSPTSATELPELSGHGNGVVAVGFSSDGRSIASGSYDMTVKVWDVSDPGDPATPLTLTGHAEVVYAAVFTQQGRTLVTAGKDDTVRLWGLGDQVLSGHQNGAGGTTFSPDGTILAVAMLGATRLWSVAGPGPPRAVAVLPGHTDGVWAVAFSADGRLAATGSLDRQVRVWNVADPARARLLSTFAGDSVNVLTLAFAPHVRPDAASVGAPAASGDRHRELLAVGGADGTAELWDLTDPGHPRATARLTGHADAVHAVAFAPDRATLATASADQTVRLWALRDDRPELLRSLRGHGNAVNTAAFSSTGRLLVTGSDDHTVRLWDLTTPGAEPTILSAHTDSLRAVAFSPTAPRLATVSYDGTARLWDIADPGRPRAWAVLAGHTGGLNSVAFSPDGRVVVTGGRDATVRLWPTDPEVAAADVCALVRVPMTRAEWQQRLPATRYRRVCP